MQIVPAKVEQGAYTAGYSFRPLWWLALGLAMPGVFVVVGMTSQPPDWTFVMAGSGTHQAGISARVRRGRRSPGSAVFRSGKRQCRTTSRMSGTKA